MDGILRPDLATLAYKPVKPLDVLSAEIGLPESELVKLDANENLWEIPSTVREAMASCCMHIYPDPLQLLLRKDLAEYHNVKAENIVAGAGSDDLLDVIIRMVESPALLISTPTFGMYSFLAKIAKMDVIDIPRKENFELDDDKIIATIQEKKIRLAIFASPNNPTGNSIPTSSVQRFLTSCPSCLFVLDEAYSDFARETAEKFLTEFDNVMLLRTFSKWAGLAGLRVGYAIGHRVLIDKMIAIKQPYNINAAAERASRAAIKSREEILVTIRGIIEQRDRLFKELSQFPLLSPVPSDANFVLCKVDKISAGGIALALRCRGILVRFFGSQGGDLHKYFRVSAGRVTDSDKFLAALKEIIPQLEQGTLLLQQLETSNPVKIEENDQEAGGRIGLLFDMDGVLANVKNSYRRAIIDTAAEYGISISSDEITEEKAKGNANNDWILTTRMVAERWTNAASPPPSLEQVTAAFERIYQGTDSTPGLRATESLIPSPPLLRALSEKYPCAIVTGRPRKDALYFLEQHGIADCFKELVCMHDCEPKPSPEPVLLALKKLKCSRAFLIGDTVDDIRSAVDAGVIAVGVPPPGEILEESTKTLSAAGATFVVTPGFPQFAALL